MRRTWRKAAIAVCAYMLNVVCVMGQNLVVNGSFEEYTACPNMWSQVEFATGWWNASASPDYFNRCCVNDSVGVPLNIMGHQEPFDGDGYMGMCTYSAGQQYREYIQSELSTPFIPGLPIYISMRASPGGFSNSVYNSVRLATSGIGVKFSMQAQSTGGLLWPGNVATSLNSVLGDTSAWTEVSGYYVPDSAYAYITIGCFTPDPLLMIEVLDPSSQVNAAYAFVDAVCVSHNSTDCPLSIGVHHVMPEPCNVIAESAQDALYLRFGCAMENSMILDLVDMAGVSVSTGLVYRGASEAVIPVQGIANGAYIVRARGSFGQFRPVRIVHINP